MSPDPRPVAEQLREDNDECARCGHTALHHAGFGTGDCQHPTGCACHEFRAAAALLDAPAETVVAERLKRLRALLKDVWDAHRDAESPDYNQCEQHECVWCAETRAAITALLDMVSNEAEEKATEANTSRPQADQHGGAPRVVAGVSAGDPNVEVASAADVTKAEWDEAIERLSVPPIVARLVVQLRQLGDDVQRGHPPNVAEQIWDIADAIAAALAGLSAQERV